MLLSKVPLKDQAFRHWRSTLELVNAEDLGR